VTYPAQQEGRAFPIAFVNVHFDLCIVNSLQGNELQPLTIRAINNPHRGEIRLKNHSVVYASSRAGSVVGCRCPEHQFHVQFGNVILTLSKEDFSELTALILEASTRIQASGTFPNAARN